MSIIKRPQAAEDFMHSGNMTMQLVAAYGETSPDVLDQPDTISLEELRDEESNELSTAGVDDLTPVDTFLEMQGDRTFVTTI